jgi:hypothetical protein
MAEPNVNAAAFPWLGHGGGDACAVERAADALHCDTEPLGNDPYASGHPALCHLIVRRIAY